MTKKEILNKIKELEKEYDDIEKENCHNGSCDGDCSNCGINMDRGEIYGQILNLKEELKNKDKSNTQIELENKEKELEEQKSKYLYLQADLENIRKRYNKQIEDMRKYEGENIFKDLLEIFDNLEYSYNDDIDILNTYNKLMKVLNKYDVRLIYEDERPVFFNPEYDEAITSIPTNDSKLDNSIHEVYQKGFFYKDKVLRYEKVIINKYNEE